MGTVNAETKIYSHDGVVYVGMTREEAYKDKQKANIFAQVDTDNSGTITQGEIQDYDWQGESISINEDTKIYVGKRFDPNCNNNNTFKTLRNIDLDGDGEISESEYKQFKEMVLFKQDYENKIEEYKSKKESQDKAVDMRAKFLTGGIAFGLCTGINAIGSNAKIKFIQKVAEKFVKHFNKPAIGKGLFVGGLGIGLGILGYAIAAKLFPVDELNSSINTQGKELFQMTKKNEEYDKKYNIESETQTI